MCSILLSPVHDRCVTVGASTTYNKIGFGRLPGALFFSTRSQATPGRVVDTLTTTTSGAPSWASRRVGSNPLDPLRPLQPRSPRPSKARRKRGLQFSDEDGLYQGTALAVP